MSRRRRPFPFVGEVGLDGKLETDVRVQIADYLRTFAGRKVEISLREYKDKRSLAQNARYWALLTVGATSLWEDPSEAETLHEEIAHLLLALPPCPKTGMRRRQRTPKLNTAEFTVYMDRVEMKLVELGADLSEWDNVCRKAEEAA
jgi:hypothetical protein